MKIEWNIVLTMLLPFITLFLGAWLNRYFEKQPKLIAYFSHISAFTLKTIQPHITVNTHSVVLHNSGNQCATNIRLHHTNLPAFNIWPSIVYNVETLSDGSTDIIIPKLVQGEQITISYLYFPPLLVDNINSSIKCDQGFSKQIPVLLQRQYPQWFNYLVLLFVLIGIFTVCYFVFIGIRMIF